MSIIASSYRFRDSHLKIHGLKNVHQGHEYNIRNGAIRMHIHDFLSDGNGNVCSLSHRLGDIRNGAIRLQIHDFLSDGNGNVCSLYHRLGDIRNGAIRLQIHDFLSDGNGNVCSLSHRLGDIRKSNKLPKV